MKDSVDRDDFFLNTYAVLFYNVYGFFFQNQETFFPSVAAQMASLVWEIACTTSPDQNVFVSSTSGGR